MTATDRTPDHGRSARGRTGRRRWVPLAAATAAAALTAGAIATAGGGTAGAATAPHAQSAGNFLDATIGGNPIDNIAKLAFARAQNPGSTTDQNPLDVTLLNAINLPLTGSLQLPKLLGIDLGAVNQVALAKSDGASYGATGAVLNSGGVSVGGNNSSLPASAGIDLCASAIANSQCGTSAADALGEVKASINGVSSIARTPKFGPPLGNGWPSGCGQSSATCYDIASLDLSLGSPQLGSLLSGVTQAVGGVLGTLGNVLAGVPGLPANCSLSPDSVPTTISLAGGAVTLNVATATLTVSVDALLKSLGLDINAFAPNTDLVSWLLTHLSDVLSTGLSKTVDDIVDPLKTQIGNCLDAIKGLGNVVVNLLTAVENAVGTATNALGNVLDPILNALTPLTNALKNVIDIGVNVQPQVSSGDFTSALDTNPKQGMTPPPVPYEHTVRAVEVKVLGDNGVTLALANSAAGPSNPAVTPPTSPPTSVPPTNVPTGVPAGMGSHGGTPALPLILLVLAGVFAAGGVASYRMRGSLNRH
jgi:hypothetical protein